MNNQTEIDNIKEALRGLKIFQTYRLNGNDEEREIFTNAMIEAELQPWQITSLIEALQKNL